MLRSLCGKVDSRNNTLAPAARPVCSCIVSGSTEVIQPGHELMEPGGSPAWCHWSVPKCKYDPVVRYVQVRTGRCIFCKGRYVQRLSTWSLGVKKPCDGPRNRGPPPWDHDTMCHELLDGNGSSTMSLHCAAFKKDRHGHDMFPGSYEPLGIRCSCLCLCSHYKNLVCSSSYLPLSASSPTQSYRTHP